MASQAHFIPVFTTLFLSLNIFSPRLAFANQQLIDKVCDGVAIEDREACLKTFSTPQALAANNVNQLVGVAMNEGVTVSQKTFNLVEELIKKPNAPVIRNALKTCEKTYSYVKDEFNLITPELAEDAMSANYDVALINPEIENCANALEAAKFAVPQLVEGNRAADYYANLGYELTVNM
ncbi:hypothetical protein V6N13_120762 [Hibiscus sabdariffa]|uniref:Pectinesterase inhibitor domain-containing protein n=1 Tax=Hibiscus sabdariffa TaxID=183260 RepID=A0ABR2E5V1_9ROSI